MVETPEVAGRLDEAVDDLDATIKDIRRSIFELARTNASHDIQAEVSRLVDRAAATLKFRPTLGFEGPIRSLVTDDLAPDLLAVLSEALSNASRHAGARTVEVLVTRGRGRRAPGRRRRARDERRRRARAACATCASGPSAVAAGSPSRRATGAARW